MNVVIVEGDLLDQPVEVIVNAWNRNVIPWWLLLPQGVSGAIKRQGGTGPFKELRRHGPIPHGSRGLLDHVLATADAHPVSVHGLYLPDVPLEMIEGISHHLLRSDHAPFWRAGLPALMWTDTAEFRNPHYHRATDTPETLDYGFLSGVTRLLVHAVLSGIGADRT